MDLLKEDAPTTDRKLIIVPGCCPESAERALVILRVPELAIYGDERNVDEFEPEWVVHGSFIDALQPPPERMFPTRVVKHCPHCGKALPKVKRRAKPLEPICNVVDGGYYCNTCNERLHACKCWPCEAHWEVDAEPEDGDADLDLGGPETRSMQCCDNEDRTMAGGCRNCGDPAL